MGEAPEVVGVPAIVAPLTRSTHEGRLENLKEYPLVSALTDCPDCVLVMAKLMMFYFPRMMGTYCEVSSFWLNDPQAAKVKKRRTQKNLKIIKIIVNKMV